MGGDYSVAVYVDLGEIDRALRPASLMRDRLDAEAVENYAGILDAMPPVKLTQDPATGQHWVDDGAHTISAARKAKRARVLAVVTSGTYLDAFHRACLANATHGVPIRNADKRRRVAEALKLDDVRGWSNVRIAEWCGVGDDLVAKLRPQPSVNEGDGPPKTVGRDGVARTQRSSAEVRRIVYAALEELKGEPDWPWTPNRIAKHCEVSRNTVVKILKEIEGGDNEDSDTEPPPAPPPPPPAPRHESNGHKTPTAKAEDWESGDAEDFLGLSDDERKAVAESIEPNESLKPDPRPAPLPGQGTLPLARGNGTAPDPDPEALADDAGERLIAAIRAEFRALPQSSRGTLWMHLNAEVQRLRASCPDVRDITSDLNERMKREMAL